jgi:hypothetical protein
VRPVDSIARQRLSHQAITGRARGTAAAVVGWLGAVQAQEYPAAKWGIALRMERGATDEAIERAFQAGRILRTHVMRPTWHFVTPRDIRWLLELTAERVRARLRPYDRRLELDSSTIRRALAIVERALGGRRYLTRTELSDRLQRAGIAARGQRLAHLVAHAELEGVICSGPRRGKQFTYALLAERAPASKSVPREEAIAELAGRFFRSHGPATVRDFVWWSGLSTPDAKRGIEMIRARHVVTGNLTYWFKGDLAVDRARRWRAHLLPVYDEYLVAYRDRTAVPHGWFGVRTPAPYPNPLVLDGQVAGVWRAARMPDVVRVEIATVRNLTNADRQVIAEAVDRYARFAGAPAALTIQRRAA